LSDTSVELVDCLHFDPERLDDILTKEGTPYTPVNYDGREHQFWVQDRNANGALIKSEVVSIPVVAK
jgi:hypothetical protein